MKKILFVLFGVLLFVSCSSDSENIIDSKEDVYIKTNLSKILNLSESDINDFKKTMVFDSNGKLSSWNSDILEMAYNDEEEFTSVNVFLINELGGNPNKIIIVDNEAKERILYPKFNDKKILSLRGHMLESIEGDNYRIYKDYIKNADGGCMSYTGHSCVVRY